MAVALLLLNGTLLAAIYACARIAAGGGVSPLGVLAWQVAGAAIVVGAVAAARGDWPALTRAHLRYAFAAGLLGITLPSLVTFAALAHVPAGTIGVIGALSPAFTYAIALAVRIEPPRGLRALGVGVGLGGVLALVLPSGALPAAGALPWALAAIAAPLLLAAGNVYRSAAWPRDLRPLGAAALMLALQAALVVPLAFTTGTWHVPSVGGPSHDLALYAAAALMTAFYFGAFELQRLAGAVLTGQLGSVIAIASLVIGVLAFGESYGASAMLAVGVVLAGVALVTLDAPQRREAARRATA